MGGKHDFRAVFSCGFLEGYDVSEAVGFDGVNIFLEFTADCFSDVGFIA